MSDELNHASLVLGARLSGSTIRVFKHNSESVIRNGSSVCLSSVCLLTAFIGPFIFSVHLHPCFYFCLSVLPFKWFPFIFIHCFFILLLLLFHIINVLRALMLVTTVWLYGLITFITVENTVHYNVHTYCCGSTFALFVSVLVLDHYFSNLKKTCQPQCLVLIKISYHVACVRPLFGRHFFVKV